MTLQLASSGASCKNVGYKSLSSTSAVLSVLSAGTEKYFTILKIYIPLSGSKK